MFCITGAPGVGKSVTASLVVGTLEGCVVLDKDLFVYPELDTDGRRIMGYLGAWLRLAATIVQSGHVLVFCGFARPDEFEQRPERQYLSDIHYLALTCSPDVFAHRVRERQRYGQLPERDVPGLHALNDWFGDLGQTRADVHVLDTTDLTGAEAADEARRWIVTLRSRL